MSFFSVPLSGLNGAQSSLRAISGNLANSSTDGYKDQNVTFSDLFAQSGISNGAMNPIQLGAGVRTASTTSNFTDGNQSAATGISSNMALSGNGFFVAQKSDGTVAYSRAGDFTTNKSGQIVAPDGSLIMGYPATNGVVNTAAALQPLQVGTGMTLPANATSTFNVTQNLNATADVGTVVPSQVNVVDSLGVAHQLSVQYTKTGANSWSYAVTAPTADLGASYQTGTPVPADTQIASGTMNFDTSGTLVPPTDPSGNPVTSISGGSITGFADGAAAMNLDWNLVDGNKNTTITQTNVKSGTSAVDQNGYASGSLSDYAVQSDGTIQGTFTNGKSLVIGQVAVATVANSQGLQQIGNNLYQVTAGSGQAVVGTAGTGGRATITGGVVEQSNVDVANEFSKMIVAQQAYQANAKVVTTFNQVEQSTLAMLQA